MLSHARTSVALTAAVGLSFACVEATSPPSAAWRNPAIRGGPATGDVAPLAGTYVQVNATTPRIILSATGTFAYRHELSAGVYEIEGTFFRIDSAIGLLFNVGSTGGGWNASATVRGDTLVVTFGPVAQQVGFVDGTFVRVRAP